MLYCNFIRKPIVVPYQLADNIMGARMAIVAKGGEYHQPNLSQNSAPWPNGASKTFSSICAYMYNHTQVGSDGSVYLSTTSIDSMPRATFTSNSLVSGNAYYTLSARESLDVSHVMHIPMDTSKIKSPCYSSWDSSLTLDNKFCQPSPTNTSLMYNYGRSTIIAPTEEFVVANSCFSYRGTSHTFSTQGQHPSVLAIVLLKNCDFYSDSFAPIYRVKWVTQNLNLFPETFVFSQTAYNNNTYGFIFSTDTSGGLPKYSRCVAEFNSYRPVTLLNEWNVKAGSYYVYYKLYAVATFPYLSDYSNSTSSYIPNSVAYSLPIFRIKALNSSQTLRSPDFGIYFIQKYDEIYTW